MQGKEHKVRTHDSCRGTDDTARWTTTLYKEKIA